MISTSIFEVEAMAAEAKAAGKTVFLHIDLAEGLGRDDAAVRWCVERIGVDGLISTRPSLLKAASELGVLSPYSACFWWTPPPSPTASGS